MDQKDLVRMYRERLQEELVFLRNTTHMMERDITATLQIVDRALDELERSGSAERDGAQHEPVPPGNGSRTKAGG